MIDWDDSISDEMMAAYLDGNASFEECSLIQPRIGEDSMLSEVIDIANDINQLGLDMSNDNLIMNSESTNMGWNNSLDMPSTHFLTIPECNDDLFQLNSFNNGFEGENNDLDISFDNKIQE